MKAGLTVAFWVLCSAAMVWSGCTCDDAGTESITPEFEIGGDAPEIKKNGDQVSIEFGDVLVGVTKSVELTIRNKGDFRLEVSKAEFAAGSSTDFAYNIPALKLDPQQTATISVAYTPTAPGADTGSIILTTNVAEGKQYIIGLTGNGVQPNIEVCVPEQQKCNDDNKTQLEIDFGQVKLGESAGPKTINVKNAGEYPLSVTESAILSCPWDIPDCQFADMVVPTVPEFEMAPASIAGTFAGGQAADIAITYKPVQGGAAKSALRIVSDDADELEVWVILRGAGIAPRICPNPPVTLDFGTVTIGSSLEKSFTFTSCGTEPLLVSALAFEAGITPEFSWAEQPQATPFDLAPGQGVTAKVKYAPTNEGEDRGRVEVTTNDPNTPNGYVQLIGRGAKAPSCDMIVNPATVDFGAVPINGFANKVVDVQNVGDADCSVTEVRGPTGAAEFTMPTPPTLPATLTPGGAMSFSVQYKPTAEKTDQATVVVVSPTDPAQTEETVTLNGRGVKAPPCSLQADPGLLSFGAVAVGSRKDLKTKIYNFGSADCEVFNWALTPGSDKTFTHTKSPFPMGITLAPGKFTEINVTYTPDKSGPSAGKLEVSGGGDNPFLPTQKVQVTLNGSGLGAQMCVSPVLLDYGPVTVGSTKDLSFEITSCGAGTLSLRQIAFDKTPPVFTFTAPPGAPLSLPAGQKKTVTVRYRPTAAGGDFGRVVINANDPKIASAIVELRGNYSGNCPTVLVCWPSQLNFGQVEIGKSAGLSVTCVNHGTSQMTVDSVGPAAGTSPEFHISSQPTPATLQSGGQFAVQVGYVPTDVGTDSGWVTVASTFQSEECKDFTRLDIKLSGEGVMPDYPVCIQPKYFTPTLEWAWPGGKTISNPTFKHVFMTPIVINLTDDNKDGVVNEKDIPDIVFNAFAGFAASVEEPSIVRAISGDDGHEIFTIADTRFKTNFETQLAAADIDGDNLPEILASKLVISPAGQDGMSGKFVKGNLLCFEHDGTFKWESDSWTGVESDMEDGSAIGIADLDHDGRPEVFRGPSVFDNNGKLLWEGKAGRGATGHGVFAFAADLDGAGNMELVAGDTAYRSDGSVFWNSPATDGVSAPADFNGDGKVEVVLFPSMGGMHVLNGQTGAVLASLPKSSPVGSIIPPSIADLDGDGVPEIGAVGVCSEPGSQDSRECFWGVEVDKNTFAPTQIWEEIINDATLGAGVTSFDFEGDGVWEMLQNDEQWVNIYRGKQHDVIYHASRHSVTGWELPVVVDVDNDKHAEIIIKQDGVSDGILVYGNADDDWVATKRIWNQFGYHITNINENGTIPLFEVPNWTLYNNYLANQPFCRK